MRIDIDAQGIGTAAIEERLLPVLIVLNIVYEVEAETIIQEGLRQIDIIGIPVLPLALVIAIDQLLIEVEDRCIRK
ncbi:MAG TPA: hypothetical protein PLY49_07115 [Opitutaceae bacterium]|nr:hypothetical protein [Opitutaceae bacterium]